MAWKKNLMTWLHLQYWCILLTIIKECCHKKIGNGPISQFKKKLYVLKYIRKAVGTKILEMGTKKIFLLFLLSPKYFTKRFVLKACWPIKIFDSLSKDTAIRNILPDKCMYLVRPFFHNLFLKLYKICNDGDGVFSKIIFTIKNNSSHQSFRLELGYYVTK